MLLTKQKVNVHIEGIRTPFSKSGKNRRFLDISKIVFHQKGIGKSLEKEKYHQL